MLDTCHWRQLTLLTSIWFVNTCEYHVVSGSSTVQKLIRYFWLDMKSWDCQYKYKHLNGIWYWYDMIFWKHIQVTCYHFWRSLGLFAPCANLVTFQNSYFNEHRADCKITDEHPMNFGDRYCVKTRWIFKTWWKPGEISRPGENLVNVQNLVKTWWIFKTWWKPGEFSKLGENLVNFQNLVKTWWFLCCEHEEVFYRFQIHQKKCFEPTFWWKLCVFMVKMDRKYHWTKTWWKLGEFSKPGENRVNFQNQVKTWWKPGENSVKTWWKLGESLVKTRWKLGENLVNFENLVKTWWRLGENLVKTRWKLGENLVNFQKPGENLVKTRWKLGENLVKKAVEICLKT